MGPLNPFPEPPSRTPATDDADIFDRASATPSTTPGKRVGPKPGAYVTQITGTTNGTLEIGRIEVVWSIVEVSAARSRRRNCPIFSVSFYDNSDTLVYTDLAISGGIVQPIGDVSRGFSSLVFNAISGVSIVDLDNDLFQLQFGAATDTTYHFYDSTSDEINVAL